MSRARRSSVWRAIATRLGLISFGLIVALLLVELLLQTAALYGRATGQPPPAAWLTNRRRVLCLGDSNTYGIFLERNQTYPFYLEQIWNAATPSQPVEVLNFGFPGLNSSKMRKSFNQLIDTFRPDLVLVLVGSNDPNSVAVPVDDAEEGRLSGDRVLWRYSRVFRFLYMLASTLRGYEIDYRMKDWVGVVRVGERQFDLLGTARTGTGAPPNWAQALKENVQAMAAAAAAKDARLILLTYASQQSLYGAANRVIRQMSLDLDLIDLELAFRVVCHDGNCPEIFFGDQHPNGAGYQFAAAVIWERLRQLGLAPTEQGAEVAFAGLDPLVKDLLHQVPQAELPPAAGSW